MAKTECSEAPMRTRMSQGSGRCLFAAALCCLLFGGGCQDKRSRAIERADDLAFQGRYEEAIFVLDELIASLDGATDSESEELLLKALFGAGRISHLFSRRPDKALLYFRRVAEISPSSEYSFDARERMARIHLEADDQQGAIAQFQALVAGFPDREELVGFQYEMARTYFAAGDLDQARTETRHLLNRWPDSDYTDRAKMLVATTLQVQGNREEAMEAYKELRESTEDSEVAARALFEEAGCLAAEEREEEALAAYMEVLKTHPEPRLVRMRLERLRVRMSRRDPENLGPAW